MDIAAQPGRGMGRDIGRGEEHLGLAARLRRGELGPEEAAEVEAFNAAFEARRRRIRGEGASYEHL